MTRHLTLGRGAVAVMVGAAGWLATVLVAGPSAAAGFEEHATFTGRELTCTNLLGRVDIEGTEGKEFEVIVRVQGKDASREQIRIEKQEGDDARLDVIFPVHGESKFVYPPLGRGSNTTITFSGKHDDDDPLEPVLRKLGARKIHVSGKGSGLEMWADVTIRVPRDRSLSVAICVGAIEAARVASDIELRTRSGSVSAKSMDGDLYVDTGSGEVTVEGAHGSRLRVDTGSGAVHISGVDCRTVNVDTGSGKIVAKGVSADNLLADTGSGSIEITCERIGAGSFKIDTGSGSVELTLPANASAEVSAETGSGNIDVDVGSVQILSREKDSVAFRMGEGAADIQIDTGSGSIEILR